MPKSAISNHDKKMPNDSLMYAIATKTVVKYKGANHKTHTLAMPK